MVKRRAGTGSVVAGSVWESRMKIDEVKGGIKVFNGEESNEEGGGAGGVHVYRRVRRTDVGKRKTWNSESLDKTPIQIAKERSDEPCKELSVSPDGIKKSPIQTRKTRSELTKELTVSVDGLERSPIPMRKGRSEPHKGSAESGNETEKSPAQLRKVKSLANKANNESGTEKSPGQLRKTKSASNKDADKSSTGSDGSSSGTEKSPVELGKAKIESNKAPDESNEIVGGGVDTIEKDSEEVVDEIEKGSVEIVNAGSDETSKEFGVCKEEVISSDLSSVDQVKTPPEVQVNDDNNDVDNAVDEEEAEEEGEDKEEDDEEEEGEEEEEIEVEIEEKSLDDVKEISIAEQKPKKVVHEEKRVHPLPQKPLPVSSVVNKNLPPTVPEQKPFSSNASKHQPPIVPEQKLKRVVSEEKKVHQTLAKPLPISPNIKKQPPLYPRHNKIYSNHTKPTPNEFRRVPQTHNKLQNLIDLVMWSDVSKSAFVFGIGTFTIISSSYTTDLNISLISVVSYLGLVYLAAIFLYRTFIFRGASDLDDSNQDYVLGEEEAIWLIKMVLPYLNEFLLKLRCLFSGDPSTTMKLAVLLFILARSGSSITIWKMAKLGFFGVFTVPKVCSCYSNQLTGYGNFWVRRFRDAWESCSHKKAVAAAIFTLVWNLSSIVARIWAVFMLFVAVRYYQQTMVVEEWVEDDTGGADDSWQGNVGEQRQGRGRGCGPTIVEIPKVKKGS